METQRAKLDELMAAAGLGFLTERVAALARPSIRFHLERVASEDTRLGATRVGGDPDMPEGFEWPLVQGEALPFVAQVNLAEVGTLDILTELPPSGMLYFFFGEDAYFAAADIRSHSWKVIYRQNTTALRRTPSPASVPSRERYRPCHVHMAAELTLPPLDPYDDDSLRRLGLSAQLPDEQPTAYWEVQQILATRVRPKHHLPINRLWGWAEAVQWEVERECLTEAPEARHLDMGAITGEAQDNPWRLLLQIDTDDAPDIDWAGTGRVYFLIREHDLLRRNFESTWALMQST